LDRLSAFFSAMVLAGFFFVSRLLDFSFVTTRSSLKRNTVLTVLPYGWNRATATFPCSRVCQCRAGAAVPTPPFLDTRRAGKDNSAPRVVM
jgi:hypothetical protein